MPLLVLYRLCSPIYKEFLFPDVGIKRKTPDPSLNPPTSKVKIHSIQLIPGRSFEVVRSKAVKFAIPSL